MQDVSTILLADLLISLTCYHHCSNTHFASYHDSLALRNLKGKNPTSIYAGTSYDAFCSPFFELEGDDAYVSATSPWATGALNELVKGEATDEEIATALEELNVCGGNGGGGGTGNSVVCSIAATEDDCNALKATNVCGWSGNPKSCSGSGDPKPASYEATFADSDITCSGVRDAYVETAHGATFADGSICEDDSGCTLGDGNVVAKGDAILDGSTCDNTSTDPVTLVVTDTPCYSKHQEDYDGYYMCYNPNSPHLYPRTICQPNDEEPAASKLSQTELDSNLDIFFSIFVSHNDSILLLLVLFL